MHEFMSHIKRIHRNRFASVGMIFIGALIIISILAPFFALHDPVEINHGAILTAPGVDYPLGTDNLGRCMLSRLIYGTRVTLAAGFIVVIISALAGLLLGAIAGYFGGIIDEIIMRIIDIFFAFPGIILALIIAGILGNGFWNIIIALTISGWTHYARLVRASVLSIREKSFIESSRALGASHAHIIVRHIIPNCFAPLVVLATSSGMSHVILAISALSFLGIGIQPPSPDWGAMLRDGIPYMQTAPHFVIYPGLCIMVTILACNFTGDGVGDFFNVTLYE